MTRPNVEVIDTGIESITADGIRSKDGTERKVDAIVYGTGFKVHDYLAPMRVTGLDGRDLNEAWRKGAEAYLGITVHGFPNFFMLYGPNTNAITSIIIMLEAQANYIVRCIRKLENTRSRYMNVLAEPQKKFNEEAQERLSHCAGDGRLHHLLQERIRQARHQLARLLTSSLSLAHPRRAHRAIMSLPPEDTVSTSRYWHPTGRTTWFLLRGAAGLASRCGEKAVAAPGGVRSGIEPGQCPPRRGGGMVGTLSTKGRCNQPPQSSRWATPLTRSTIQLTGRFRALLAGKGVGDAGQRHERDVDSCLAQHRHIGTGDGGPHHRISGALGDEHRHATRRRSRRIARGERPPRLDLGQIIHREESALNSTLGEFKFNRAENRTAAHLADAAHFRLHLRLHYLVHRCIVDMPPMNTASSR